MNLWKISKVWFISSKNILCCRATKTVLLKLLKPTYAENNNPKSINLTCKNSTQIDLNKSKIHGQQSHGGFCLNSVRHQNNKPNLAIRNIHIYSFPFPITGAVDIITWTQIFLEKRKHCLFPIKTNTSDTLFLQIHTDVLQRETLGLVRSTCAAVKTWNFLNEVESFAAELAYWMSLKNQQHL